VAEGRRGELKKRVINALVAGLPSDSYQKRPFLPDLLHQPDLLMVPELGRIIVLFVYEVKRYLGWGSALAWFEDLIEVKLSVGEYSLVCALVMTEPENIGPPAQQDIGLILGNALDGVYFPTDWKHHLFADNLRERLAAIQGNPRLSQLRAGERKQVWAGLRGFDETRYKPLVDKSRIPELPPREAESRITYLIAQSIAAPIEPSRFVPNVKGYLARSPRRYRFKFDIGIGGREPLAIDVIQSQRYGSRAKLRYLMAKGRLLRYAVDAEHLRPQRPDFRPALIVDGNISGPDHDPYRYVRALLSVGWELFTVDQIPKLRELL
jgi:hypothetical protein